MRSFLLLVATLTMTACATPNLETSAAQRAAVAVTFDRETAAPVIVEGITNRATGMATQANDPVRVASISKLVMALGAMQMAGEGVVDLDRDVSDYLGWQVRHPDFPDDKITLAMLMSHRAGLRDKAGYVIPLGESLEEKLTSPDAWARGERPGEAIFEYSNLNSPLVATVMEAASGERFDRLMERSVFAPLGVDACFNWIGCSEEMIARAVPLYRSTGEPARDYPDDLPPNCTIPVADGMNCLLDGYRPGTNASIFSPQGGLRIGMRDLAIIGQAILNEDERVMSARMWRRMKASVRASMEAQNIGSHDFFCIYGLGIQAIDHPSSECQDKLFNDGTPRVGHAGEAYGLRSGLWLDPAGERGIAYFVTAVPDRTKPDEGGFAPEEVALVRRAIQDTE